MRVVILPLIFDKLFDYLFCCPVSFKFSKERMLVARLIMEHVRGMLLLMLSGSTYDLKQHGFIPRWNLGPRNFPVDTSIHGQVP